MFENSSVMVISVTGNKEKVCRLDLDNDTQKDICTCFSDAQEKLINSKNKVMFDGSYKPNEDEFLSIGNFQLPSEIMDAVRDPIGVESYEKESGKFPEIKAVFVGERIETNETEIFNIAFQRFRKDQYISTKWYNLFFDENTFFQEKRFGISITDSIDCFYTEGELQFTSFFYARQVFDLNGYYRSATDQEVDSFATNEKLFIEDHAGFKKMSDTWVRRKIAMINDSKVLENYSPTQIKKLAANTGIDISVENKRIKIPNDKGKLKVILGFLDEEAYKGPFSKNTYLANSKRQI